MASRVPTEPFLPVLHEYLETWRDDHPQTTMSPMHVLAFQAGMKTNTLCKILSGRSRTIEFDVADNLLCVMDVPFLWFYPPFNDIYYSVDLTAPEVVEPVIEERCRNGHIRTEDNTYFYLDPNNTWQGRCAVCREIVYARRRKKVAA